MPVARQNDGRTTSQGAVDIRVVLGIIEKRPEMKPRLDQFSRRAKRVKNAVDLVGPDPGRFAKDSGPLQNALVFQDDSRRDCERDFTSQHPPKHGMGRSTAGTTRTQKNIGIGNDHPT